MSGCGRKGHVGNCSYTSHTGEPDRVSTCWCETCRAMAAEARVKELEEERDEAWDSTEATALALEESIAERDQAIELLEKERDYSLALVDEIISIIPVWEYRGGRTGLAEYIRGIVREQAAKEQS